MWQWVTYDSGNQWLKMRGELRCHSIELRSGSRWYFSAKISNDLSHISTEFDTHQFVNWFWVCSKTIFFFCIHIKIEVETRAHWYVKTCVAVVNGSVNAWRIRYRVDKKKYWSWTEQFGWFALFTPCHGRVWVFRFSFHLISIVVAKPISPTSFCELYCIRVCKIPTTHQT